MKLFDVVNKNDHVISTATASECHADPQLIHRVVHFTLIDEDTNNILITQRSSHVKFDSGLWCFMGEHVLSGETYEEAVWKGLQDELGILQSTSIAIKELCNNIFSYATQTEFVRFFVAKGNFTNITLQIDEKEIVDYKWLTLEDLIKNKDEYSQMTRYWLESCNFRII